MIVPSTDPAFEYLKVRGPEPWHTGYNAEADDAMREARVALQAGDALKCFAALRVAMYRYGWEYHSDRKARRLWKRWDDLAELARRDPAAFTRADGKLNYVDCYHEMFRSVHLDRDRRIRRNVPP